MNIFIFFPDITYGSYDNNSLSDDEFLNMCVCVRLLFPIFILIVKCFIQYIVIFNADAQIQREVSCVFFLSRLFCLSVYLFCECVAERR